MKPFHRTRLQKRASYWLRLQRRFSDWLKHSPGLSPSCTGSRVIRGRSRPPPLIRVADICNQRPLGIQHQVGAEPGHAVLTPHPKLPREADADGPLQPSSRTARGELLQQVLQHGTAYGQIGGGTLKYKRRKKRDRNFAEILI